MKEIYINLVLQNRLSSRDLKNEIKTKSFDRLSYASKKCVKLIITDDDYSFTIKDMIKDPILIKTKDDINNLNEKSIHKYIIEMLEDRFLELGKGFALIGHEYKIIVNNITYKLDLLFYNYELDSFVVVEIKNREAHTQYVGQLKFYVNLVDKTMKKTKNNNTIGILIVKKKNSYIVEFVTNENLFITTFQLLK